jgi:hypothetical protein
MDKNWELKLEPPTNDWLLPDVWEGPNAFPDKHNTIDESVCFDYKVLLSFKDNIWMFDNNSKWHFLINLWERTATVEEVKEVKKLGKWNWEQSLESVDDESENDESESDEEEPVEKQKVKVDDDKFWEPFNLPEPVDIEFLI